MPTEQRAVSGFDRVRLEDVGILEITQGDHEALTVEADAEVLPKVISEVRDGVLVLRVSGGWLDRLGTAINAGFSRTRVRFAVTVKSLVGLAIAGVGRVDVGELKAPQFTLELHGGADVHFKALTADRLEVRLSGAGSIEFAGKVAQQQVVLSGAGSYSGGKLESQTARVTLSGAGSATVWATQELDATLAGLGSVQYYGNPQVRKTISGLGSVQHLGER